MFSFLSFINTAETNLLYVLIRFQQITISPGSTAAVVLSLLYGVTDPPEMCLKACRSGEAGSLNRVFDDKMGQGSVRSNES